MSRQLLAVVVMVSMASWAQCITLVIGRTMLNHSILWESPMTQRLLTLFGFFFLTGCAATQSQFLNMPTHERQSAVCFESAPYKSRLGQMTNLRANIDQQNRLLSQGYRVHRQCRQVQQPTNCEGYNTSMGKTACQGTAWTNTRQECTETPVAIDPNFEESKRNQYVEALRILEPTHQKMIERCLAVVSHMSPNQAYLYYSKKLEPQ